MKAEIFRKVKEMLKGAWHKGYPGYKAEYDEETGTGKISKRCLVIALADCLEDGYKDYRFIPLIRDLMKLIPECDIISLMIWNDAKERTEEDVLNLLDRAIETYE